ncbi:uncharacterized protein NECHADRAFT_85448 [Fusarium vanettenii 77-13-4]|uniref:RING-type domain-containing protein n=1 Tax=Fusarium vanettenii (strain ATCC MYA-4622 / CBS 123669 / FGSC 9596 / NRRL 45880 / 77-13-4) TaxID=660122 RepID=C7ZNN3_FUSV7|nr:uncharacterized protein NECHADRAFT_85448 [Fusarium vanettenii 77-13-4]EEU34207.1 hypothetical protein NECHADRAFT_85448 [Fusarium vanettenii 77-13-4]
MEDDESLSHQLVNKLLIEEIEVDDALKEQRRQRASAEVLADRLASEESAALPSGTSTHTDRLRDLYQHTLGPSVVGQPSQETSAKKDPVVDAAGDAPKPSPAPVKEDDGHEEDDDDLYRDDGVTIHRRPMASLAPAVAAPPAPVTDDDDDLYRDDGVTINRRLAPFPTPLEGNDKKLSRDDKAISQWQRTLKTSSRGRRPSGILGDGEARRIAAEARRRDPLSSLPVEANDRRRTVCGLTQVLGAPGRRSQPVVIHEDNDEEDLISFENTVTYRPGTQPDNSSLGSMASDSHISGISSLQAQQSQPLRPQPSPPVNSLQSISSGLLNSGSSSTRPQTSRPETAPLHSRPSAFLRSGTSSRHNQSFCPNSSLRRPEPFSIHSETSSTNSQPSRPESSCTETSVRSSGTVLRAETSYSRPPRSQFPSSVYSETAGAFDSEPSYSRTPEITSVGSQTSSLRPQTNFPHPQPSSSRFGGLFANPRPEDNVRPHGASAETDPDKENVYCHACGKDVEGSVVLCPCGHYYCPQCLGRIVESSVGGDSSPFPPLCCGKPVPVDVNSTIFDKDVLRAFVEKKLGLPLSERATRAAQTLPPAVKRGESSASAADVFSASMRPCALVAPPPPASPPGDPVAPAPVPLPAVRAAPISSGILEMGQAPATGAASTWGVSRWCAEVAASMYAWTAATSCVVRWTRGGGWLLWLSSGKTK